MVGGDALAKSRDMDVSKDQLIGPTDETPTADLYSPSVELAEHAELLCESDEELVEVQEIVNGENFLLHGELTIGSDSNEAQSSHTSSAKEVDLHQPTTRDNPLLIAKRAEVIEELAESRPSRDRINPVTSRRKSFGLPKTSLQPKSSESADRIRNSSKSDKPSFPVYSPTTYSKVRTMFLEPEPEIKVRPSCHYYGTKRIQHNKTSQPESPSQPNIHQKPKSQRQPHNSKESRSRNSSHESIPRRSSQDGMNCPNNSHARHPSSSPVGRLVPSPSPTKHSPHDKRMPPPSLSGRHVLVAIPTDKHMPPSRPTESSPNPSVITIEPDSTSQSPSTSTKSSDKAPKPSLSLMDDDVFEYTPIKSSTSPSKSERLVKNEDRYSKYELAKMVNERHSRLSQRNSELAEKTKQLKEMQKKMSSMKGNNTKLTKELKDKNRVLKAQSAELIDLEGSKSDCEIFNNKLKDDMTEVQKLLDTRDAELERLRNELERERILSEDQSKLLDEQRKLHRNLSLAHSSTLAKVKMLAEGKKNEAMLFKSQLQDKDVLIRKLEQGLTMKMETVAGLVKDKNMLEELIRNSRGERDLCTPFRPPIDEYSSSTQESNPAMNSVDPLPQIKVEDSATASDNSQFESPAAAIKIAPKPSTSRRSRGRSSHRKDAGKEKRSSRLQSLPVPSPAPPSAPSPAPPSAPSPAPPSAPSLAVPSPAPLTPSDAKLSGDPDYTPPPEDNPGSDSFTEDSSPASTTPRTRARINSAVSRVKRARSFTAAGGQVQRKRCQSEIASLGRKHSNEVPGEEEEGKRRQSEALGGEEVLGKRRRKPAKRYSPSSKKLVPVINLATSKGPPTTPKKDLGKTEPSPRRDSGETEPTVSPPAPLLHTPSQDTPIGNPSHPPLAKVTEQIVSLAADEQMDEQTNIPEEGEGAKDKKGDEIKDITPVKHREFKEFMFTNMNYVPDQFARERVKKATSSNDIIEVPSFREISSLLLIHEEGEQASLINRFKELDTLANYTRMHKKCEASEIRMMRQCERMRAQLEQKNKRKKKKKKDGTDEEDPIRRPLFCTNLSHDWHITRVEKPVLSAFRCPISVLKQRDFGLPWSSEIKSFAYYAKPGSSRSNPDPQVSVNITPPPVAPETDNLSCSDISTDLPSSNIPDTSFDTCSQESYHTDLGDAASSQSITLIFSHSDEGIVVKADASCSDATHCIPSPAKISLVPESSMDFQTPIIPHFSRLSLKKPLAKSEVNIPTDSTEISVGPKSGNIWSSIHSSFSNVLENSISRNIFSKFGEIRNNSSSGESSTQESSGSGSKRERPTSCEQPPSPQKQARTAIERRNIWSDWCPSRTFTSVDDEVIQEIPSENVSENVSGEEMATFDQKNFLLAACSSNSDRSPNLPPQPLTRKLEKLSKRKKPLLVCTDSSPRPSEDSIESSPAKLLSEPLPANLLPDPT